MTYQLINWYTISLLNKQQQPFSKNLKHPLVRRCKVKPCKYYKNAFQVMKKSLKKRIVINTDEYLSYIHDILQLSAMERRLQQLI